MDKITLYLGSIFLISLGLYYKFEAHVSVGLGLMWIAMAIKKGK